ncbi:MAG: HD domain-containing protein [Candidatus Aureabacteria bacterium]|nr:HD domain-containing protein [Candidatus Auribacterota bacterium]
MKNNPSEAFSGGKQTLSSENMTVAVIDIGSTAIRMEVAQINQQGKITVLESLKQTVSLGKDSFTKSIIEKKTIEECVKALKIFRNVIDAYKIELNRIHAFATSAVWEAYNRKTFLERIYIATGIRVKAMDETEANRLFYFSIQPALKNEKSLSLGHALFMEVGGGTTQLIYLIKGKPVFSRAYRFGSFRIREILEYLKAPDTRFRSLIENQITRITEDILSRTGVRGETTLVLMGGDARFAAAQLAAGKKNSHFVRLSLPRLEKLTEMILSESVDQLVKKFHLAYSDAEILGPTLFTYVRIARTLKIKKIGVIETTIRDGVLWKIEAKKNWMEKFREEILSSVKNLGKKYDTDFKHTEYTARICVRIFSLLANEHGLGKHHELILTIAALLHDIGMFVSNSSHHKHSMYLILNSDLFGLDTTDIQLIALIARYHRKALPDIKHEEYAKLNYENQIIVSKLASLLRIADALDCSHNQRLSRLGIDLENNQLIITTDRTDDISLEEFTLKKKANLFEQVYGMSVLLRKGKASQV